MPQLRPDYWSTSACFLKDFIFHNDSAFRPKSQKLAARIAKKIALCSPFQKY